MTTITPILQTSKSEILFNTPLSLISHIFAQVASQNGAKVQRPLNYKKAMEDLKNGKSKS